jgi:predicted transcriptional regulator
LFTKTSRSIKRNKFYTLIELYAKYDQRWENRDSSQLKKFGDLRNVIVHGTIKSEYLSIPTAKVVEQIENIRNRLLNPKLVIPEFQREVESIKTTDNLFELLKIIHDRDYSQFPVYDEKGIFKGLLTENGITRWLAYNIQKSDLELVDLKETLIEIVLLREEAIENFSFVSHSTKVDDIINQFARHPNLEAIFITENGENDKALLGIATRYDILALG